MAIDIAPNQAPVAPNPTAPPVSAGALPEDQKPEEPKTNTKERLNPPDGGFLEFPADYDPAKHSPPKRTDFKDERVWRRWKITTAQEEIDRHKKAIARIDRFGNDPEALKQARSIDKALEQLALLKSKLPQEEFQTLVGADFMEMFATVMTPPPAGDGGQPQG